MKSVRHFTLVFVFLLAACSSTVTSIVEDTDLLTDDNIPKGYLLIGVDTNTNLKEILITGPTTIRLSHANLKKGSNFILHPTIAGTYKIKKVYFNNLYRTRIRNDELLEFTIEEGRVSYVGHLQIDVRGWFGLYSYIELINQSSKALEFMEAEFPNLSQLRQMYYGGPGEDYFFQYLQNLDN